MKLIGWSVTAVLTLLLGCQQGNAAQESGKRKLDSTTSGPSREQVLEAVHSAYRTPKGVRQECIGRQVFDVPHPMEWAIGGMPEGEWGFESVPTSPEDFGYIFSDGLKHKLARVHYDRWDIGVMGPVSRAEFERWRNWRDWFRKLIKERKEEIAKYEKERAEMLANIGHRAPDEGEGLSLQDNQQSLDGLAHDIKVFQQRVDSSFSFDSSDVFGVLDEGFFAFVFKDDRAYRIQMFGPRDKSAERPEQFDERFAQFVKKFRPRALYEIPAERGVCIPFGFVPDEGEGDYQVQVAMRFTDHPGVAYHFDTGLAFDPELLHSGKNHFVSNLPEPGLLRAATLGATGLLGGIATAGRMEKTFGPRGAKIGAIDASQGGFSINTAKPGAPTVPSYTIFTATDGFPNVQVLPFLAVEVSSFTKEQVPKLNEDPPPLDATMGRLNVLLNSVRLRPTSPPMPELETIK